MHEEVRRVHGVVRGAYIKWSGGVCAASGGQGAVCVVNRVVYMVVRKVYEEVRRVHGVVRGAFIKWSGGVCAALGGQEAVCEQGGVCVGRCMRKSGGCMRLSER